MNTSVRPVHFSSVSRVFETAFSFHFRLSKNDLVRAFHNLPTLYVLIRLLSRTRRDICLFVMPDIVMAL